MTADQYQLERIAVALGVTPAALVVVRPTLLEVATERFERRMAEIAAAGFIRAPRPKSGWDRTVRS